MSYYEEKKQARIQRLKDRAERASDFASKNGLELYGEASSGIPMGQPILVGHHSEKRHRRALERIENRVRKGMEAYKESKELAQRAIAAENRKAIDSDNPEALELIQAKVKKLEAERDRIKEINIMLRKAVKDSLTIEQFAEQIATRWPETKDSMRLASNLMSPDFAGRIGIPTYRLTNLGAEIRRLHKRAEQLEGMADRFEPMTIETKFGSIGVELMNGQIQVEFTFGKPSEETRNRLKSSPLALKWSSYAGRWVRKHTPTTASQYFRETLIKVLTEATP